MLGVLVGIHKLWLMDLRQKTKRFFIESKDFLDLNIRNAKIPKDDTEE